MNHGSLFTGIGGIDLGFERAGIKTIWQVENDKYAVKVLEKNFPKVRRYGDIREVRWEEVDCPDIISGGFPCQDISVAGKGKGIKEGTRSGLWFEFAKIIRILRPRYAVIENVSNISKRGLDIVLAGLAEAGYDAQWIDLRASDFGLLHKRERIFIIAHSAMQRYDSCDKECFVERELSTNNKQPRNRRASETDRNIVFDIAHDWDERIQRCWKETLQGESSISWCKSIRRVEDLRNRPDLPEPLIRGTSDGIPDWMDRIKCLGNAVVPQVAEYIGRCLIMFDNKEARHSSQA